MGPDASLTPELIQAQTFTSTFRGYDTAEVRAFLNRVANELRAWRERAEGLESAWHSAEERAARPPVLDEDTLMAAVGEETAAILRTARAAAAEMRSKAAEEAERALSESRQEAERTVGEAREEAERSLAEARAAAERLGQDAEAARSAAVAAAQEQVSALLAAARHEATEVLERVAAEAEEIRSKAEKDRQLTIEGANSTRDRILEDLSRRRRVATVQIEQLRAGRERLIESYAVVRRTLEEVQSELSRADAEARAAADDVGRRLRDQPEPELTEASRSVEEVLTGPVARGGEPDAGEPAVVAGAVGAEPAELPAEGAPSVEPASAVDELFARIRGTRGQDEAPADEAVIADGAGGPADEAVIADGAGGPADEVGSEAPGELAQREGETHAGETAGEHPPEEAADEGTGPEGSEGSGETGPEGTASQVEPARRGRRAAKKRSTAVQATNGRHPAAGGTTMKARPTVRVLEPPAAEEGRDEHGASEDGGNEKGDRAGRSGPAAAGAGDDGTGLSVPDGDESLLQAREYAVVDLEVSLTRRLKRILQDEQNDVLDRLRNLKGTPTAESLLPDEKAQVGRYSAAARPLLVEAASAGAVFTDETLGLPGRDSPVDVDVAGLAAECGAGIVGPLRRRLEKAIEMRAGDEQAVLVDSLGAAYREWKTQRIERLAGDVLSAAFSRGTWEAAPDGTMLRWVAEDIDGPCPDCDDDALAGDIPKGEVFPTGQYHPPAHSGCRCLLVPSVSAD